MIDWYSSAWNQARPKEKDLSQVGIPYEIRNAEWFKKMNIDEEYYDKAFNDLAAL